MFKTTKKILLRFVIAPLVLVALLYLIYKQILQSGSIEEQWANLKSYWHQSNKFVFALVLLLVPLNWLTEAFKWRIGLKYIYPVSLFQAFKGVLTGISFAMISPGKVGDFAGRILHVPHDLKLKATIATLLNNVIQALATSTFGLIGLVYFNIAYPERWSLITLVLGLLVLIVGAIFIRKKRYFMAWLSKYDWYRKAMEQWALLRALDRKQFVSVYLLSLLRYFIYNAQFLLLLITLGAPIGFVDGLLLTFLMFWLIAVIPSFLVADLGVRGFIAGLVFINTGIINNTLLVLSASYLIWLMNLVVPAVLGSMLILFIKHQKKDAPLPTPKDNKS